MEQNIAHSFEELVKAWGEEETFKDLIGEEYFNAIYLETANLVRQDCPLDEADKVERLSKLWQIIGTAKVLPNKDNDHNPFRRLLLRAYKQENFKQALVLMKSRNQVAKHSAKVFSKVRTFFNN